MSVKIKRHKGACWIFVDDEACGYAPSGRLKRPSKRIGSRDAAEAVKKEVERLLALGQFIGFDDLLKKPTPTGPGDERFEAYATRWLTEGEVERKAHSHRFYKSNLTNHVLPAIGQVPPRAVSSFTASSSKS